MSDAKKHLFKLITLSALFAFGVSLSGCADSLLPKVNESSVKILKNAIEVEFTQLTREFDQLDQTGDLGLCAPLLFGIARFAVYQAVEEKRTSTMEQLTRFIMRARAAIKQAEEKMQKKQCVDTDGDGLTDIAEYRKYKTKPDNPDTDGDNVSDSLEVRRYQTNPLKTDTDGDLLDDGDEISRGLSPLLADSDGDGFIDGIEIAHRSNARDPCSQPLDAQNLDRMRECVPKQTHAKPVQVQSLQKRTPAPEPKTKRFAREKRRPKAEKSKTKPSPKPPAARIRNIEKANFEKKKPKSALTRNGSHPAQKNQAIRIRQANMATPAAKEPQKEITYPKRNHLPAKPQDTNQQIVKKVNAEGVKIKSNSEESPSRAPITASLTDNSEKTEIPTTVPSRSVSPKPAKKKMFPSTPENFPSAIFLRLW
ncbi:MAG: hypothetical protein OXG62_13720 [Nitrospinae bacterium]|nr:hypothetical protein [Nitrospinota bacterium]